MAPGESSAVRRAVGLPSSGGDAPEATSYHFGSLAPPSPRWLRLAVVASCLLLAAARIVGAEPFPRIEDRLYDAILVPLLPAAPTSDEIVLVHIDERTLRELGQRWPLDRRTWAGFMRRLAAFEPKAVAVDVLFDQPSLEDARLLADEVRRRVEAQAPAAPPATNALLTLLDDAARALDADQQLSDGLATVGNVTLGAIAASGPTFPNSATPFDPVMRETGALALDAQGVSIATPLLFLSARQHGTMNVLMDGDGVVRRYPYMVSAHGDALPSLALATRLSVAPAAAHGAIIDTVFAADRASPYLRFRNVDDGAAQWATLSFSDVLFASEGNAAMGALLRGKYVFVGATAPGVEDLLRTPVTLGRAGVELHATALDNLLLGTWLVRDGAAAWISLLMVALLLGAFAFYFETRPRARSMATFAFLVLMVELGVAVMLADQAGWLVMLAPVPLGIALLSIGEGVHRLVWTRRELERLRERERLLETERAGLERLRAVVEHVGDAIVSVDADERIRWMNPAAELLFRRRARTAVDRPVSELVPHFEPARASGEAVAGDVLSGEVRIGAETIPIEATATVMSVGGERYTNFVVRDVAARKAVERQKDEFIASINHELRTPLTSILGSLKLVSGGAVGEVPDKAKELLEIAEKNGELLLSLVSDLLDSAKIESGRLVLQTRPVPLGALLADAIERLRGFALRYDVGLELAPLPDALGGCVIEVDKQRIVQVIGNLVSNAIKHSPKGGIVRVAAREVPGRVRIEVVDRGPGLSPEMRDQVFERFSATVPADGRRRSGTGLGLAIARGLVEAHRGDIGFDSEPGHGTTFWFELPRA